MNLKLYTSNKSILFILKPYLSLKTKNQTHLRLESAKQMTQIRMFGAQGQDLSLNERRVHIVVLQNDILFQALDGIIVRGIPQLGQQDLLNNLI